NKTITHSSGTTVYNMYELYAWLMNEVDESGTIDNEIPMTAQTPTSYTLTNRWFIDETSIQFLQNGSLKSDGWSASANNDGIRILTFAGAYTSAAGTDIGKGVTQATSGHTGTLLAYDNTLQKWWVRVDDTGDNFNTTNNITVDAGTGQGIISASGTNATGDNIWTNVYTLGTLYGNTHVYIVQNDAKISSWWSSGHIDMLLLVKEGGTLIDYGNATIVARQYSKLYDHFLVSLSSGARTPVPLATFEDSNNDSGYRQMVFTDAAVSLPTVGEIIEDDTDATIQGIVTSTSGSLPSVTVQYYLASSNLNDFTGATGALTGQTSGMTATAVAPTNVGPTTTSGITFTFGATSQDLGNGNGSQPYDVIIDCNSNSIEDVYEYLKYVTRRGSSTSLNGYDGDQYVAVGDIRLSYESQTANFAEGNTLTGGTSGATGVIVSDHDDGTSGALVLKEVVGTFEDAETITDDGIPGSAATTASAVDEINPSKQSPFGTFAGGKFFGGRGVWLSNVPAGDANNYQLIDSTGTDQIPPLSIALIINNTQNGDRVAIFKTTGDNEIIDKSQFSIQQAHTSPVGYIRVSESITADTPSTGVIRVVRMNGSVTLGEERYSYTAWSNANQPTYSEFTLSGTTTRDYDSTDDTAYVPYIDEEATGSSVSESITYVADTYVLTRVRITGMLPFKVKGQVTNSGLTVTTIRTSDSIYQ
ncbi:hypothetical protein ACFL1M_04260, partial [Patescibacteria group bacterium]